MSVRCVALTCLCDVVQTLGGVTSPRSGFRGRTLAFRNRGGSSTSTSQCWLAGFAREGCEGDGAHELGNAHEFRQEQKTFSSTSAFPVQWPAILLIPGGPLPFAGHYPTSLQLSPTPFFLPTHTTSPCLTNPGANLPSKLSIAALIHTGRQRSCRSARKTGVFRSLRANAGGQGRG
eukprot:1668881-Rhodomonas_salina.1